MPGPEATGQAEAWFEQARRLRPDWIGTLTRRDYLPDTPEALPYHDTPEIQLEFAAVLAALREAEGTFTMLELGAGFGMWTMRAAVAARSLGLRYRLVAVEAEPTHFGWLRRHAADNGVRRRSRDGTFRPVRAAVAAQRGRVHFHVGAARDWYGQAIAPARDAPGGQPGTTTSRVRAVRLADLVPRGLVDLIHLDVQGVEAEVIADSIASLRRVRYVQVGTHSTEIETTLRTLFTGLGWTALADYALGGEHDTPYGRVCLVDGAQTWRNPAT